MSQNTIDNLICLAVGVAVLCGMLWLFTLLKTVL
jgi:hypothetical protein